MRVFNGCAPRSGVPCIGTVSISLQGKIHSCFVCLPVCVSENRALPQNHEVQTKVQGVLPLDSLVAALENRVLPLPLRLVCARRYTNLNWALSEHMHIPVRAQVVLRVLREIWLDTKVGGGALVFACLSLLGCAAECLVRRLAFCAFSCPGKFARAVLQSLPSLI